MIILKNYRVSRKISLILFFLFVLDIRYASAFYLLFMLIFYIELLNKWKIKDFYIYSCLILMLFSVSLGLFHETQYVEVSEGFSLFIFGLLVVCVFLYRFSQLHFQLFAKMFRSRNELILGILFPPYFLKVYKAFIEKHD